jgi:nucleoside-diphosphate-sugar epimerase
LTRTCLIGHTGFVGSNLARQTRFDATYNSSNIESITGEEFDLLVCAGVRAEKWIANANPEADRAAIDRLLQALDGVKARRAILISTVDVFITPLDVDETTPVITAGLHPYGKNRYHVEQAFADRFDAVIARLAGLYGPGIKKNVIHDFLFDHQTEKIDSRGVFQFYGLHRLWSDLELALANHLEIIHLPTAPVSVADVALAAFGRDFTNHVVERPARYDVRTRHAALLGGRGHYVENKMAELEGIRLFVQRSRPEPFDSAQGKLREGGGLG